MGPYFGWLGTPIELCLLDLLLCGDNVLVVAVACRALPGPLRARAMKLGIAGAVVARFVLTAMASVALALPGLRLVGAGLLVLVALNLASADQGDAAATPGRRLSRRPSRSVLGTTMLIILADVLMSLDNAVALAAVAGGNLLWLAIGLALCIPPLFYGSTVMIDLFARAPALVVAGAAFLGWIAGDMIVSDPLLQAAIATQSQALPYLLPPLLAGYVLAQTRVASARR